MITKFFKKGSQTALTAHSVIKVLDNPDEETIDFYRLGDVLRVSENSAVIICENHEQVTHITRALNENFSYANLRNISDNYYTLIIERKSKND